MRRATPWLAALSLLTTLPVGRWLPVRPSPREQGQSVACYPWVGALIGALLAAALPVVAGAGPLLGAALVLLLWIGLTGALHLDGLADCVDGAWAGHGEPARILAVMQDPAAGPVAVVALVGVLLLKFAALAALMGGGPGAAGVLWLTPVLARAAVAGLMMTTTYCRPEGIARYQAAHLCGFTVAGSVTLSLLLALFWVPVAPWAAMLAGTLAVLWAWRRGWRRRIGGYTGDVAGGLIELVEAATLVIAALAVGA